MFFDAGRRRLVVRDAPRAPKTVEAAQPHKEPPHVAGIGQRQLCPGTAAAVAHRGRVYGLGGYRSGLGHEVATLYRHDPFGQLEAIWDARRPLG